MTRLCRRTYSQSGARRRGWSAPSPGRFTPPFPQEKTVTHCTGGWVVLGVSLDVHGKTHPHR